MSAVRDSARDRRGLRVLLGFLLTLGLLVGGSGAAGGATGDNDPASEAVAAAGDVDFRIERLAGSNRYATAAAISHRFFSPGVTDAFVVTGENFPDGLSAGPAGDRLGGPVLFVRRDDVPAATYAELDRLNPGRIVVVGGTSVISESVRSVLARLASGGAVRVSGDTRYATAAALSARAFPTGATYAFVATGADFPDALTGGTAAGVLNAPLLLTAPDSLSPETAAELARLSPDRILLLGGTNAVSAAVASRLATYGIVERVSGSNRYQTALAISKRVFGPDRPGLAMATGRTWPDALSVGPAARFTRGPVLLSTGGSLPTGTPSELQRLGPSTAYVIGGLATQNIAIPQQVQRFLGVCWAGSHPSAGSREMFTSVPSATRQVAFTFDMGGRVDPAISIVNYLARNQVCSTFFPTGAMADTTQGRAIMRLIASYPHLFEIGNHTMHHCDLVLGGGGSPTSAPCAGVPMTASFIRSELLQTERILAGLTGLPVKPYWRPPYGSSNTAVREAAASVGYTKTVMWNRDSIDWDPDTTASQIVSRVTSPLPPNGSIALFHLGGYVTYDALPTMVTRLRNNGYTLTTISDMRDG